ncbi:MAG: ABC transporter permease subunit [Actinobacteria bacterium]|nr:ABC transporter permease subunit [Actinomycetota bacterium]MSX62314.1 ABC transporter permease subunit [Actinomycetota bacterium]MTA67432.1 ABC transporter permease subunit [Actinomycetota bacterium]
MGASITLIMVIIGLISIFWIPLDVNESDPSIRMLPIGTPGHLFGTDYLGRDVTSMLMTGVRTSVIIGACSAFLALFIGTMFGMLAASVSKLDEPIMRTADIFMAMPGIIFALVLASTIGAGYLTTIFALTSFFTPAFVRVTRASSMRVLAEDYISVARLYGRGKLFITFRHVLPNISSILIVQFTIYFAAGVLSEAGLSFLGVGINRPSVSLGMMLHEAVEQIGITDPLGVWPGLGIVILVIGLNLLGDGLRDYFDPRFSQRAR